MNKKSDQEDIESKIKKILGEMATSGSLQVLNNAKPPKNEANLEIKTENDKKIDVLMEKDTKSALNLLNSVLGM